MKNLNPRIISIINEIIASLDDSFSLDGKAILEISGNDPKMAETVCEILEKDGWIKATKVNGMNYPYCIFKSDSFRRLFASGNYADRAKAEKQKHQHVVINATNSNFAIGNTAPVNQIININQVIDLIQKVMDETGKSNDITLSEKEEIIELLKDLNNSVKQGYEPPKSILKRLAYYGEKVISIGAAILSILSIIKG